MEDRWKHQIGPPGNRLSEAPGRREPPSTPRKGWLRMKHVDELGEITYRHRYVSTKRLTWLTMAITAAMGALYFVIGFPPAFDTFHEKMYFHSVGIGLAALAAYLIIGAFDLERHEPPLDFPLSYRAFGSVVLAALGGLVFLSPTLDRVLPHIGMLAFIAAFVLIADVGGALLVELFVLPRKLAGTYRAQSHNPIQYLTRLLPFSRADLRAYRGRGLAYWLTLCAVASFFIAELIGFLNLWVMEVGTSVFGRYISWLGLDRKGFLDATLDPHSHMAAIAIMAGILGVAAVSFPVLETGSAIKHRLAKVGLWLGILGVAGTTLILGAVAFFNYSPPTLFASGPGGVNGMAGDDVVMSIVLLGAILLSAPLVSNEGSGRDGVGLLFAATWLSVLLINVAEGFYIEFHESLFQGSALAKDASFAVAQPMTGIFLLTTIALGLLLLYRYPVGRWVRRSITWAYGIGLSGAVLGSTLWTFADPSKHGFAFSIYVAGTGVSYLAVLLTGLSIRRTRVGTYERSFPEDGARALAPIGAALYQSNGHVTRSGAPRPKDQETQPLG